MFAPVPRISHDVKSIVFNFTAGNLFVLLDREVKETRVNSACSPNFPLLFFFLLLDFMNLSLGLHHFFSPKATLGGLVIKAS